MIANEVQVRTTFHKARPHSFRTASLLVSPEGYIRQSRPSCNLAFSPHSICQSDSYNIYIYLSSRLAHFGISAHVPAYDFFRDRVHSYNCTMGATSESRDIAEPAVLHTFSNASDSSSAEKQVAVELQPSTLLSHHTNDNDHGREYPSEEEKNTLRHVSDEIPWVAYIIAFVELCERFSSAGTVVVCKKRQINEGTIII
jgi:hypothetical protein